MTLFQLLVFGAIVGIAASVLDPKRSKGGVLGAILVGSAGAFMGGMIANFFLTMGIVKFSAESFILAIAGALALLFLGRDFKRAQ